MNATFRHTDNVGFQNHQNFGAYNQHPSLWPGIPSPRLHISLLPGWVRGSVLRWWLAFPQAGFSQLASMNLSRRSCDLCHILANHNLFAIHPDHLMQFCLMQMQRRQIDSILAGTPLPKHLASVVFCEAAGFCCAGFKAQETMISDSMTVHGT
ncbi:MAG: hypothetical protein ACXQTY_07480 [Candidatus Methanogasteraceae archaeon]